MTKPASSGRKKCTSISYNCGSICLGLQKTCRIGSAAIGKDRLNKVKALAQLIAGGGKDARKGIGKASSNDLTAIAGRIEADRNRKAQELRDGRRKPENPREEADLSDFQNDDYEFARKSKVQNLGQDLKGSARHKRNEWRSLVDAEKDGTAQEMITRDNLLKHEPHKLTETITPTTALSHLAAHLVLKGFPAKPFDEKMLSQGRIRDNASLYRQQYYEAYQQVKELAEKHAINPDPSVVIKAVRAHLSGVIQEAYAKKDFRNPVISGLHDMLKRTQTSGHKSTDTGAKLNEFSKKISQKYKDANLEPRDLLEKVQSHAMDIMEGKSMNQSFDTVQKKGEDELDPRVLYSSKAERKGGRKVGEGSIAKSAEFLMKDVGMRGIQYGNSLSDGEREYHTHKVAEAFADLADVTGLPDHAISLGGKLGLAIGARGKGSALAHYEPSQKVINLTRANGVGSLAHEWSHGLDNVLSDFDTGHMSSETSVWGSETAFPEGHEFHDVAKAMSKVVQAMRDSGFDDRLYRETLRRKKMSTAKRGYWTSTVEKFARVFEGHVDYKLQKAGRKNSYLSSKPNHPFWATEEEQAQIAPHIDNLMAEIAKTRLGRNP